MKYLIIEASPRNGLSQVYARRFSELVLENNHSYEIVRVRDLQVELCIGCNACLKNGEEYCPFVRDDIGHLHDKMVDADAIVYFTPNYSLNVPGKLKMVFDRLAFIFHRPRLFGKSSLCFVTQGVYGGNKVLRYVDELMGFWGCNIVRGSVLKGSLDYKKEIGNEKEILDIFSKAIGKIDKQLGSKRYPSPSLFKLIIYRMTRSSMRYFSEATDVDKKYYEEKGWNTSDYYYKTKLNFLKKIMGKTIDRMIYGMAKKERLRLSGLETQK